MRSVLLALAIILITHGAIAAPASRAVPKPPGKLLENRAPISLERGARPLSEVLSDLEAQTELPLRVGPSLTEQKVTVRFQELPLSDAVRALAEAVDGEWHERTARRGKAEFVLEASERRRKQLDLYRKARRETERERDRLALAALLNTLGIGGGGDVPRSPEALTAHPLMFRPEPLFPLVRSLPPAAIRGMIENANESFPTFNGGGPERSPSLVLPGAALSPAQREIVSGFLQKVADEAAGDSSRRPGTAEGIRAVAARPEMLRLEFWGVRNSGDAGLSTGVLVSVVAPSAQWSHDFALSFSAWAPFPPGAMGQPGATGSSRAEAGPKPKQESRRVDVACGKARMDRALLEIARAAGVNLAAEYYTKPDAVELLAPPKPLGIVLGQVEAFYRLEHRWLDGTLVVRARDWAECYDREPTAPVVDAWEDAKRRRGFVSLQEFLMAAERLNNRQITGLYNHTDERGNLNVRREVERLALHRDLLRGYAALTAGQRSRARSERGLPLAELNRDQAGRWLPIVRRYLLLSPDAVPEVCLRIIPAESPADALPAFLLLNVPGMDSLNMVVEQRPPGG